MGSSGSASGGADPSTGVGCGVVLAGSKRISDFGHVMGHGRHCSRFNSLSALGVEPEDPNLRNQATPEPMQP